MEKKKGGGQMVENHHFHCCFPQAFRAVLTQLISAFNHPKVEIVGVPHSPPSVTPASAFPSSLMLLTLKSYICKAMKTQRTSMIPPWKPLQVVKAMRYFLLPPHWAGDFLTLATGMKPSHPTECSFNFLFFIFLNKHVMFESL